MISLRALFFLALLAIVHFSVYPWVFDVGLMHPLVWMGIGSDSDRTDILVNLCFYVVPALVGQWAFGGRGLLVVGGLSALSLAVEMLQAIIPGRYANLRDVGCNAAGAVVGVCLARWWRPPQFLVTPFPWRPQAWSVVGLMLAFATWQAFPFLPYLRYHRLLQMRGLLAHAAWPAGEMVDVFFAVVVLYLAARTARLPGAWLAWGAVVLLMGQNLLRELQLSPARVVAAGLALAVIRAGLRAPGRRHYLTLAVLGTAWAVGRSCEFVRPGGALEWLPFFEWRELLDRAAALRLAAGDFLLPAGAIWLWHRAGISWGGWVVVGWQMASFLAGQTTDSTGVWLALAGEWLVRRSQLERVGFFDVGVEQRRGEDAEGERGHQQQEVAGIADLEAGGE